MIKESLIEKIKLSFVIGFLITLIIFVAAAFTGLQTIAEETFFTIWLLSFVAFLVLILIKDNLAAKKGKEVREKETKSASWWEAIPEPVLIAGAIILLVAIVMGLLIAVIDYNNQAYGWRVQDHGGHERASLLFPEKLEIINLGKNSLVLEVDSTKVEFISKIENGKYIQAVKFLEPGNYTVWVNNNPLAVRVYASASEMKAQQEPGPGSLAVFIAFAGIFAITRRNRKGG